MSMVATIIQTAASSLIAFAAPHLDVTPATALIDRPVVIRASGLAPGSRATFTLETTGARGERWQSIAICEADRHGAVDLRSCKPLASSSYASVDAMGLFWSMRPVEHPDAGYFPAPKTRTTDYRLTLESGSAAPVTQAIVREAWDATVRSMPAPAPLVGTYFVPVNARHAPAVLVLGGSEGGHAMDPVAALLASHGYAALSLAYFGASGLPKTLVRVPLETAAAGFAWLARQPEVDPSRIGVWGISKGGEYALLAAARSHDVKAVVAVVPSAYAWFGLEFSGDEMSSWSENGVALPFLPSEAQADGAIGKAFSLGGDVQYRSVYDAALRTASPATIAQATIPVDRITAPLLLVCGEDDREWDSCGMTQTAIDRFHANGHAFAAQRLAYPNAGHAIGVPYLPTLGSTAFPAGKARIVLGGTAAGNAFAASAAWANELRFLNTALHGSGPGL